MTRIDSDSLATHLEDALTCAPQDTLAALQDADSQRRRRATFSLAQHLAHRLECFEILSEPFGASAQQQESFFEDAPRIQK